MSKKSISIFICLVLLYTSVYPQTQKDVGESGNIKVLAILPNYLGANFNFNKDNLEYYGWDVTYAAVNNFVTQCANYAGPLGSPVFTDIDLRISGITDFNKYDVIFIMPATWQNVNNAYGDLIDNQNFNNLLSDAKDQGAIIWATCAGVRVLAKAGIINGVKVSGKAVFENEFIAGGALYQGGNILPVIDKNIVTSTRGMYFHLQNIEAVHTALEMKNNSPDSLLNATQFEVTTNNFSTSGNNSVWSNTYGGTDSEGFRYIINTSDNCLLSVGYTYSSGGGRSDILLVKTDLDGNVLWSNTFGGTGWDYGYAACETENGDYVITGSSTSGGNGSKDFIAIRVDSEGNEIWKKTYGGNELDIAQSIVRTQNNNYLIAGYTESYGAGKDNFYLICIDANGNEIWSKTYGGNESEMAHAITKTSDGNYVVAGSTGSWGEGNRDIYLVKVDEQGTVIWGKTIGDENYQTIFQIKETIDGNLLMIGHTDAIYTELLDLYLVKADANGNKLWEMRKEYSHEFYDFGRSFIETSEGNIVICGSQKQANSRENDVFISMLNNNGVTLWTEYFNGPETDWANSICAIDDNTYFVAGHTSSDGSGKFDGWVFKYANQYTDIDEVESDRFITLAQNKPNPFTEFTEIKYNLRNTGELKIFDNQGKLVKSFNDLNVGEHIVKWNGTNEQNQQVSAGVYYYQLISNSKSQGKKMLIVR